MKTDAYTKFVLTAIAIFLGLLALGHGTGPGTVIAQTQPPADAFANVQIIPCPTLGFIMFDRQTGGVWAYDVESKRGFPFKRLNSGRIEKPGADVQPLP